MLFQCGQEELFFLNFYSYNHFQRRRSCFFIIYKKHLGFFLVSLRNLFVCKVIDVYDTKISLKKSLIFQTKALILCLMALWSFANHPGGKWVRADVSYLVNSHIYTELLSWQGIMSGLGRRKYTFRLLSVYYMSLVQFKFTFKRAKRLEKKLNNTVYEELKLEEDPCFFYPEGYKINMNSE